MPRFRRRPPASFWLASVLAAALAVRWWSTPRAPTQVLQDGTAHVVSVVDGRTLKVLKSDSPEGTAIAVRLLGIARLLDDAAARRWLETEVAGKTVRIELDKRRRDLDGTHFAYVYLGDTFVNGELLRRGWAQYDAYPGDSVSHAKVLRTAAANNP